MIMIKVSFGKKVGTLGILVWAEWLKISGEKKALRAFCLNEMAKELRGKRC